MGISHSFSFFFFSFSVLTSLGLGLNTCIVQSATYKGKKSQTLALNVCLVWGISFKDVGKQIEQKWQFGVTLGSSHHKQG
jgi:hypothetical protein